MGFSENNIMLCGLKIDRPRAVNERDVATFARGQKLKFREISSKEGTNMSKFINDIVTWLG